MFVGHYAGAFVARAYEKRLPLAAAFIAAQFVDLWWDFFILTGVEHARIVPGLASNPLDLYFMPYTHSLLATLFWASLVFGAVKATKAFGGSNGVALAAAGAVASHWFLDLVVHRRDLPLASDESTKLGLALWNHPTAALAIEIVVLAVAAAIYQRKTRENPAWIAGFVCALAIVQVATALGPLPPTLPLMSVSLMIAYVLFALLARYVQRRASIPNAQVR